MFVKLVHLGQRGTPAWGKTQRPRAPIGKSENVSWYVLFFFAIIISRNKIVLIVPVPERIHTMRETSQMGPRGLYGSIVAHYTPPFRYCIKICRLVIRIGC